MVSLEFSARQLIGARGAEQAPQPSTVNQSKRAQPLLQVYNSAEGIDWVEEPYWGVAHSDTDRHGEGWLRHGSLPLKFPREGLLQRNSTIESQWMLKAFGEWSCNYRVHIHVSHVSNRSINQSLLHPHFTVSQVHSSNNGDITEQHLSTADHIFAPKKDNNSHMQTLFFVYQT